MMSAVTVAAAIRPNPMRLRNIPVDNAMPPFCSTGTCEQLGRPIHKETAYVICALGKGG